MVPSFRSARECAPPAAIATTPFRSETRVAATRAVDAGGLPSSPYCPSPQVNTRPSRLSAMPWEDDAAIAMIPESPGTGCGVDTLAGVAVARPSWPDWLSPQARTLPALVRTRLHSKPAATAIAPLTPVTWIGV